MIIFLIAVIIFCCLPWYMQLVFFVVNLFFPDPIPVLDELLMLASMINKVRKAIFITEIIRKYGKIIFAIVLMLLLVIALLLFMK